MWITVCMWRFPWTPITPFWLHEIGFVKNIYRYPMNLYKICTITEFDEAFCIAAAISKTSLWCARFDSVQFFFSVSLSVRSLHCGIDGDWHHCAVHTFCVFFYYFLWFAVYLTFGPTLWRLGVWCVFTHKQKPTITQGEWERDNKGGHPKG